MKSIFIFLAILLTLSGAAQDSKPSPLKSLVRVNMTSQEYSFDEPWEKDEPHTHNGLGVVLKDGKIVTAAKFIANSTYLEIEHPENDKKIQAKVVAIDYEANLALLTPLEPLFSDRIPLHLTTDVTPGDILETWQVERNGTPLKIKGKVSRAQIGDTFLSGALFLQYEMAGLMEFRGGSVTVPVIKGEHFAGLLVTYDPKEQMSVIIAAPVIEHFLKDIEDGVYQGFPRIGLSYSSTQDDQFRKYLKLSDGGGIYVNQVKAGQSSDRSGIKKGDVVLNVAGYTIDSSGYYTDEKLGKINFQHLLRSRHVGDKVAVKILRQGSPQQISLELINTDIKDELIEPYLFDRGPRYLVLGGLVFQELTQPYLESYGNDWRNRAPFELSYANFYPIPFTEKGLKKLVFLSRVIPTSTSVGYEDLSHLIVTRVNGKKITMIKDLDDALSTPIEGSHKIEFSEYPSLIYVDAEEAGKTNQQLKIDYGIDELKRIE